MPFTEEVCSLAGLLTLLLFLESIATLAVIAGDRYIMICHPLHYAMIVKKWRAACMVVFTWCQSSVLASIPLFGIGRYAFRAASLHICMVDYLHSPMYSLVLFTLGVVPACIVIFVCYARLFYVSRVQARKVCDLWVDTSRTSQVSVRGNILWDAILDRTMRHMRVSLSRMRGLRTVFTIMGCFFLCWLPYTYVSIYSVYTLTIPEYNVNFIVTFLAFSSSIANPFICLAINKEFRKAASKAFGCQKNQVRSITEYLTMVATATAAPLFGQNPPRSSVASSARLSTLHV